MERELPALEGEARNLSGAKEQLVIYNVKGGMQNVTTVIAIATLALTLFSVISLPVAIFLLAGSLWARYCVHENIEQSLTKQVNEERVTTLNEKIHCLAHRAKIVLPELWKAEGKSNLFGTYLFRESIPEESLFPRGGERERA